MDKNAQLMFDYLRDVLYAPGQAALELDKLGSDFRELGEGLLFFGKCVDEQRRLAAALARGHLDLHDFPSKENELVGPLKSLHATLRHLSWQTQQVAKGDYQQHVDFIGTFADAFNTMTHQLDQRQKALMAEIESGRKKNLALEQNNSLFEAITAHIPQWIVVLDSKTGRKLYLNDSARAVLGQDDDFSRALWNWLREAVCGQCDLPGKTGRALDLFRDGRACYLSVDSYPLHWRNRSALAVVITDVSEEKQHIQRLESVAYQDPLTHCFNRYYGMQMLAQWLSEKRLFSICFVDLDSLKYVNDTYGHLEGDRYIISVAQHIRRQVGGAVLCRLGGDEFMILGHNVRREEAEQIMRRVREGLQTGAGARQIGYTRSISYGTVQVNEDNHLSSEEILTLADERMYQFKRTHKKQRLPQETPAEIAWALGPNDEAGGGAGTPGNNDRKHN